MTYDRVNWQNEPSENTPISAENLNKMDSAIKALSEMVEANPVEADTDELKKIGIEGTIYKIAGGHELVNSSGSTMTQRSKMEFLDTHLTDDSANNTTKVQVIKEVTSAQFANETEQGLYRITDKPDSVINAEQVAYDSNNSVKDKIDEYNLSANTKVNLSGYTSSNPYTFPSNGYLLYENNGSTLGRGYISNLLRVGDQFGTDFTKTSGNALYVKKGMTFYVETAFYKVEFYPLQ